MLAARFGGRLLVNAVGLLCRGRLDRPLAAEVGKDLQTSTTSGRGFATFVYAKGYTVVIREPLAASWASWWFSAILHAK